MSEVTQLLLRTLDQIEQRLISIAAANRVNAILGMADPTLVLPSPAVGLMSVDSIHTTDLTGGWIFRSVDPLGPDGVLLLAPVDPSIQVHPWKVEWCGWSGVEGEGSKDRNAARTTGLTGGLRIRMSRPMNSQAGPGKLTALVGGSPFVSCALEKASAMAGRERLEISRPTARVRNRSRCGNQPTLADDALASLCHPLLEIEITRAMALQHRVEVVVRFEEPLPISGTLDLRPNVVPVWNSMDSEYPDPGDIQQTVSESSAQRIHPLTSVLLGSAWRAWEILEVRGVGESRGDDVTARSGRDFTLAFLAESPADAPDFGGRSSRLALVLTPALRAQFTAHRLRSTAVFRSTMGSRGNGVPAGSTFECSQPDGRSRGTRLMGTLEGSTFGGSDGLFDEHLEARADLKAVLPGQVRSVADTASLIERSFGSEFALVDERDLLRVDDATSNPLAVRVRFHRPDRPDHERAAILRACRCWIDRYVQDQPVGGMRWVDVDGGNRR